MYLKEVIIEGFKSFADRTRMSLGKGITTIVGPNGCGKSNIVDAIRWVLGEQSAKALRGGKMNDVIFGGTDERKGMERCGVSLIFSECEEALGTQFNEVEVRREVTLEGASHYYLNGKTCRLKDIQQLFMDTGIGRVSYSFMVQGQIDQILSTNPEERRAIFEEAAGITKYKAQRHETLLRLGQVDQNLSRVEDVMNELGRQVEGIRRQANKALRYKRYKKRLRHLDLASQGYVYKGKEEMIRHLGGKEEGLKLEVEEKQGVIEEVERGLVEERGMRDRRYEEMEGMQKRVYELKGAEEQARSQAQLARLRLKDAEEKRGQVEEEIRNLGRHYEELVEQLRTNREQKQVHLDLVGSSDKVFNEESRVFEELQREMGRVEGGYLKGRQEVGMMEGQLGKLIEEKNRYYVEVQTGGVRMQEYENRRMESEKELGIEREKKRVVEEELRKKEAEESEMRELIKKEEGEVGRLRGEVKKKREGIDEEMREVNQLKVQVGALEGLQAKMEGFGEGAKAILQGKLDEVVSGYRLLARGVKVREGYEVALDAFLGQGVDMIGVGRMEEVVRVMNYLTEKRMGKACLKVGELRVKGEEGIVVTEGVYGASEVIEVEEEEARGYWKDLLMDCYFAEDLEAFGRFAEENKGKGFRLVVTRRGEVIDGRGVVYGASTKVTSGASGYIQREKQIGKLKEEIKEGEARIGGLKGELGGIEGELKDKEGYLVGKQRELAEVSQEVMRLRVEERGLIGGIKKHEENIGRYEQLLKAQREGQEGLEKKRELAEKKVEELQVALESKRGEVREIEGVVEGLRLKRDRQRDALAEIRIELSAKKQELGALDQGGKEIERRAQGTLHRKGDREKEVDRLRDQVVILSAEMTLQEGRSGELKLQVVEAEEGLKGVREGFMEMEKKIKEGEGYLGRERKGLMEKETQLKQVELALTKELGDREHIIERVMREYEVNIGEVDWKVELWESEEEYFINWDKEEDNEAEEAHWMVKKERGELTEEVRKEMELVDWDEILREVKELREKVQGMGNVNLMAIEEYQAGKERHGFIRVQYEDLVKAKEDLLRAIGELNKTSELLFKDTFEKVKGNFRYIFEKLFGGGSADLSLIDGENVLESGIEITARPPGTKLKSLMLLSGGQKTMTAVALLFAIYRVKPSPFCVLDELDAPLDDANIQRFTGMLREFTDYSQFLVISHNKRTIAASDTIYGVTMQERGVTKLISIRFNRREEQVELVGVGG